MKKFFSILAMIVFVMMTAIDLASAEGLLDRNSGTSTLQQQELDDAFYRGYNDAKTGKDPIGYSAGDMQNNGEVVRGAGRGALGGAAMGKLSDGDVGKGAAWGAGAGAIKGAIRKRREAQEETTWASELSNAYNRGYQKGTMETVKANAKSPKE